MMALAYRKCRDSMFQMFYSCEKSLSRQNPVLPIQKFPSLALPRNVIMLQHLKVVAVAYERWSLTRGSKYSDLTGKLLVFWKTGP